LIGGNGTVGLGENIDGGLVLDIEGIDVASGVVGLIAQVVLVGLSRIHVAADLVDALRLLHNWSISLIVYMKIGRLLLVVLLKVVHLSAIPHPIVLGIIGVPSLSIGAGGVEWFCIGHVLLLTMLRFPAGLV
jgi:hypothetical protein